MIKSKISLYFLKSQIHSFLSFAGEFVYILWVNEPIHSFCTSPHCQSLGSNWLLTPKRQKINSLVISKSHWVHWSEIFCCQGSYSKCLWHCWPRGNIEDFVWVLLEQERTTHFHNIFDWQNSKLHFYRSKFELHIILHYNHYSCFDFVSNVLNIQTLPSLQAIQKQAAGCLSHRL